MIAVDTNVLVAAHREEHPAHRTALDRLVAIAEDDIPWALPVFCIGEFLRVVTHPKIFTPPSELDIAIRFVDQLVESPTLRILCPGETFWRRLRAAASDADARGNLIFDAMIAAVCLEHGIRDLFTGDRDFSRFSEIDPEFL